MSDSRGGGKSDWSQDILEVSPRGPTDGWDVGYERGVRDDSKVSEPEQLGQKGIIYRDGQPRRSQLGGR